VSAELLERPVTGLQPMLGSLPVAGMDIVHVGVTGTRAHMPPWQRHAWDQLIYAFKPTNTGWGICTHPRAKVELHHGCCKGADTEAHYLAAKYGYDVSLHPADGVDEWQEMTLMPVGRGIAYVPKSTKDRNQAIVCISDVLLAAPRFPENDVRSKRSGTWQTVRMARDEGLLPIYYAMPDGVLYVENK
jgi:hypothetical protein